MKCPVCSFNNPPEGEFCLQCSAALVDREKKTDTLLVMKQKLDFTAGELFGKRYQIIERIGQGGMGIVYKAHDTEVQAPVVLKMILPELGIYPEIVDRFRRELLMTREISHDHIVRIFDIGEAEGIKFISMKYIDGSNLEDIFRSLGILSIPKAIEISIQICSALEAAHGKGIIHRDLKPQNIMIDKQGRAVVLDFGIARLFESDGITDPGLNVGTPQYMAPEQFEGGSAIPQSDIYSFGLILYQMLTGSPPFSAESNVSYSYKHIHERPVPPELILPSLPKEFSKIVEKCLEKKSSKRFSSAAKLRLSLEKLKRRRAHEPKPSRNPGNFLKKKLRHKPLWFTLRVMESFLLLALCLIAWSWLKEKSYLQKWKMLKAERHSDMLYMHPLSKPEVPGFPPLKNGNSTNVYIQPFKSAETQILLQVRKFQREMKHLREQPLPFKDLNAVKTQMKFYRNQTSPFRFNTGVKFDTLSPLPAKRNISTFIQAFCNFQINSLRLRIAARESNPLTEFKTSGLVLLDFLRSSASLPEYLSALDSFYFYFQEMTSLLLAEEFKEKKLDPDFVEHIATEFLRYANGRTLSRLIYFHLIDEGARMLPSENGLGDLPYQVYEKWTYSRDSFSKSKALYKELLPFRKRLLALKGKNRIHTWRSFTDSIAIPAYCHSIFSLSGMADVLFAARTAANFTFCWNRWLKSEQDPESVARLQNSNLFFNEMDESSFIWKLNILGHWSISLTQNDPVILTVSPFLTTNGNIKKIFLPIAPPSFSRVITEE